MKNSLLRVAVTIIVFIGGSFLYSKWNLLQAKDDVNSVYEYFRNISIGSQIDAAEKEAQKKGFLVSRSYPCDSKEKECVNGLAVIKDGYAEDFVCFFAYQDQKVTIKRFFIDDGSTWTEKKSLQATGRGKNE